MKWSIFDTVVTKLISRNHFGKANRSASNGGSRIFLRGAPTPKVGVLTYFYGRKLHERIRTRGGGVRGASLRSATGVTSWVKCRSTSVTYGTLGTFIVERHWNQVLFVRYFPWIQWNNIPIKGAELFRLRTYKIHQVFQQTSFSFTLVDLRSIAAFSCQNRNCEYEQRPERDTHYETLKMRSADFQSL